MVLPTTRTLETVVLGVMEVAWTTAETCGGYWFASLEVQSAAAARPTTTATKREEPFSCMALSGRNYRLRERQGVESCKRWWRQERC